MSNRCENPLNLAYAYLLGEVEPDQVAESAVELIEAGFETEGVLLLANVHGESNDRIEAVLRRVLRDHDYEWPAVADAGKWKANCIAREVLSGSLAPYDGAVRVVREVLRRVPSLNDLEVFKDLAEEYEDDIAHRSTYATRMREAFKALVEANH
ncbi:MAG: hypothetical protein HND58_01120 [Planctomycetota bacterium]|nr:MAG: hypothetical protein HND58_01120 [Planctomycetota bacterium]